MHSTILVKEWSKSSLNSHRPCYMEGWVPSVGHNIVGNFVRRSAARHRTDQKFVGKSRMSRHILHALVLSILIPPLLSLSLSILPIPPLRISIPHPYCYLSLSLSIPIPLPSSTHPYHGPSPSLPPGPALPSLSPPSPSPTYLLSIPAQNLRDIPLLSLK